ncbi:MAG: DUF5666 domain-containing protein [candidate division KSB1 bacterium]|nr:DUF5666 domain-containing protein [candidate division KSB1 bacterium]MDZ7273230.1 DUF5666 domain-containing protein [candidate division KSB1 bacterium]MDZ7285332.1 DUF5666 domain-containing protein [candidate division KSB1 bacterium]MDZ7298364.1 DUF5666 domain-containing protein [candidate division KSB1 bacterium]MDZ7309253.1 DUF5666 domain-containing protein [candidate division KSB1 bacterium]
MPIRERMQIFRMGQRIKVKGQAQPNGDFIAVEIKLKEGDEYASIEGVVQAVDLSRHSLRICNQELPVPESADILDVARNATSLAGLKPGDMIKAKGFYSPEGKFLPAKIKVKDDCDGDSSELQGFIQKIDRENGMLRVVGINTRVTEATAIDGF